MPKVVNRFLKLLLGSWTKSQLVVLKELTRSKFRESDYNSFFGSLWNLLNPLLMLLVLFFLFQDRFGKSIDSYLVYVLIGVISVGFFTQAVAQTIPLLTKSQEVLINTNVPARCILGSEMIFLACKFLVEVTLTIAISSILGFFSWQNFPFLIIELALLIMMVSGVSLILCLIHCVVRDISQVWAFVGKVLLFASPVFYSLSDLSEWAGRLVYWLNPLTPHILTLRSLIIMNYSINPFIFMHACLLSFSIFVVGCILFNLCSASLIERT